MKVELLSIDAIKATLQGYWRVSVKDEVTSTMNEIKKRDTQFRDLLVAEFQSEGRGRVERKFDSLNILACFSLSILNPIEIKKIGVLFRS